MQRASTVDLAEERPLRTIGVISDTHGLLRDEALAVLEGSALILHAGDVGAPEILERLAEIAPVRAVRGNTDGGEFGATLPLRDIVGLGPAGDAPFACVLHDVEDLDLDPLAADVKVVVFGHSHRPAAELRGGVLFFNPGAAGHRRFQLPVTAGRLMVDDAGGITWEILDLAAP
jgi:putative phosphoesterase